MYLFFRAKCSEVVILPSIQYKYEMWRPGFLNIFPGILPDFSHYLIFIKLWVMHYLILRDDKFTAIIMRDKNKIIHYSISLSASYRFPFMAKMDLQISRTWTMSDYGRRGISSYATSMLSQLYCSPHDENAHKRYVWWICDPENINSISTAKNIGLRIFGTGEKEPVYGMSILGKYKITENFYEG